DALAHAHERSVVHRDVKPDNVMVERDEASGAEVVKVVDFGLAKLLDAGGAMSPPGAMVGTLQYSSPEQAKGEPVDGRADLYAAGVLLFELLAGALPFAASSQIGFAVAHVTQPAPRLSERHAALGLPRSFDELLARALEKSPARRFQSAKEMRAALDMAEADLPAQATVQRVSGRISAASGPVPARPAAPIPTPGAQTTPSKPAASLPGAVAAAAAGAGDKTFTTGSPPPAALADVPPTPQILAPGTVVGRYVIEGTLGMGGMGAVYRGRHVHMKRPAAVKVIQSALAQDEVMRKRFLREARVASLFRHPCVVELYDFDEAGDLCYLAMELVDGQPLDKVLREGGPLPLPRAARVFDQILDALAAAHQGGVVHRDLKPANVMLCAGDRVKILDFGIARFLQPEGGSGGGSGSSSGLTAIGDFVGTPAYASPEQIQGFGVDGRADLYTCGVMLFEALAGRRPFVAKTAQEYLDQHLASPPPALWAARPDLPSVMELDAIVQKAMAKDSADRYQSALEMREAVLAVAGPYLAVEHAPTRRHEKPASASGVAT
ncbi:MAG TPA: protein kinase, partial [Planctomycetota bacterium]|nr:protein kinase [Planctomycetota bacterium]